MTLLFTAAVTQPTFLRGEPVYLVLTLSNPGDRPVELPGGAGRCFYSLTPPDSVAALQEEDSAPLGAPGGGTRPIGPGERWEGVVKLDQAFSLDANGGYKVSTQLHWGDLRLDSPPQEFRMEDLQVNQLTVGYRGAPAGGNGRLLFFRPKDPGKALMTVPATLSGRRDAEPESDSPYQLLTRPSEATDPVASSTDAALLLYWNFWREGNTLLETRNASTIVRPFPLPGSVQRLIEPALLDSESLTHLYALTTRDGASRLLVIRIMDYLKDPKDVERVLAERPLEAAPDATDAMIDQVQGKPRRALVLARMSGPLPKFDWMSYSGDTVPDSLRSHAWTKMISAEKLADSRPAIRGLPEGGVRMAWVVLEAGKPKNGLLCEASFDETGALKSELTTPLSTESPIKAARIVYLDGVPLVAIWTSDGKVLSGSATGLKVVVPKSPGRVPPTFLVLRTTPFVLEFDAVKGMILVPAR